MKGNIIKNLIAVVAFLVFVSFLAYKYSENYKISFSLKKNSTLAEEDVNKSVDEEQKALIDLDTLLKENEGVLDPYYTRDNINLERILRAKDTPNKEKLIKLLNRFAVSDLKEIIGDERRDYIKQYNGMKIVGDSKVRHFDYYQVLETEYYYPLAGKSIDYQSEHVKDYVDDDTKRIVFWNGYNIANYKDAEEYVAIYQNLVDSVKAVNPDIEVYICSLMPATQAAIENDFKGDIVHNIYRGKEYDEAIKKHFGNQYIDIKFMGKEKYYGNDGIHFMPQFYYMLVPYLAYYLSLEYE